jgi:hypothetical protein
MDDGTRNSARGVESEGPQSYRKSPIRHEVTTLFKSLLERLGAARQADAAQLFSGRASYRRVLDWRRGHYAIPLWAWEYLAGLLDARADADKATAAKGRSAPAMARGRQNNIAKWNARRFAEKKKPGI